MAVNARLLSLALAFVAFAAPAFGHSLPLGDGKLLLTSGYHDGLRPAAAALPPEVAERARESLAFVVHAADQLGPRGGELVTAARSAFVDGLQSAMWVAAAIMAAGAVATAVLHRLDAPESAEPAADGHDVPALVRS